MESFFFIPGTRLYKIKDIQNLNVSQIIIDLEDAVKYSERKRILEQLISTTLYHEFYIRIPLYDNSEQLNTSILQELYHSGFRKFVFPKIQNEADFDKIILEKKYTDLQIVLLIETSRLFLEAKEILLKHETLFTGLGLGSHDFMSSIGGAHTLQNLEYVRLQILYLARMIHIKAIDIASMELKQDEIIKYEILDSLQKGYDAKFFIHPWQINLFKSISLYTDTELQWAKKIKNQLAKAGGKNEFNPVVIDGQIIERPHLAKAEKIINYYEGK